MPTGQGTLTQIRLGPDVAGEIRCHPSLVPAPGQYMQVLADPDPSTPLPVSLFAASYTSGGFLMAPPVPQTWSPGISLFLRGPLGRGFDLPASARRVALVALGYGAGRLLPLIPPALSQGAAVLFIADHVLDSLPHAAELLVFENPSQRSALLSEAVVWADYLALDLFPDTQYHEKIRGVHAQALFNRPFPCGGLADCGSCSMPSPNKSPSNLSAGFLFACKDGPVFDL